MDWIGLKWTRTDRPRLDWSAVDSAGEAGSKLTA